MTRKHIVKLTMCFLIIYKSAIQTVKVFSSIHIGLMKYICVFLRRESLLGKLLRVDVDNTDGNLAYSIPSSNPYACDTCSSPWRKEIFAYGLRNPWRCDFDEGHPVTGNKHDLV